MNRRYRGALILGALTQMAALTALAQGTGFEITRFRIEGNSLLTEDVAQRYLAPHTGPGRNLEDVNKAVAALRAAYAEAGYPIVQVFPPEQTITGGEVKLRVIEGKLAKVALAGNQDYTAANIRASLPPLKDGAAVNAKELVAAITLANENPAKQVAVNFQAGATPGEVEARIDVVEDRQTKFTAMIDDYGSAATGKTRLSIGYQHANLFNSDHQFGLQYMTTAEHPSDVKNLVGSYRIPFYTYGFSLDLVAAYSDSQSTTSAPIGSMLFSGKGSYLAARLNQSLPGFGELRQKISYGIDYKDFDNTCAVAGAALPACGSVTTQPISVSYVFQYASTALQAGGSVGYASNIQGGRHGSKLEYAAARAAAARSWDALRISAFIGVPLPNDWQFRAQIAGQNTSKALVPAEQFGVGGASSVRGYAERGASGDYGYSGSLEIYTPDFGKSVTSNAATKLRALLFFDAGSVSKNHPLPTEDTIDLSSYGFGLRLNQGKDLAAKFDIGWRQKAVGTDSKHGASANLSLTYSF